MNTQLEPTQPAEPLPVSVRLIQETKARHVAELELLRSMAGIIDKVPESIALKCSIYKESLDFNNLLRDEALTVITALAAGKWTKEVNLPDPSMVDYNTEIDGKKVRLWAAAPPDSCRVIEVEEIVPETRIVRRKLVCSGSEA
jgi:hypothetical protein